MNQEDYTTAEELVEELSGMEKVSRPRKVNDYVVTFEVEDSVSRFQFPEHIYWYVDEFTHYEDGSIVYAMEFVL